MGNEITRSVSQSVTGKLIIAAAKCIKHFLPVCRHRVIYHGRNILFRKELIQVHPVSDHPFKYQVYIGEKHVCYMDARKGVVIFSLSANALS